MADALELLGKEPAWHELRELANDLFFYAERCKDPSLCVLAKRMVNALHRISCVLLNTKVEEANAKVRKRASVSAK